MSYFFKQLACTFVVLFAAQTIALAEEDKGESKAEMAMKNRRTAPTQSQIDANVTIDAMLTKNGPDAWPKDTGARIEGVVVQVESEADGDTHLVLAPQGKESDTKHWVIAEVTKASREKSPSLRTSALKQMHGKKVAVTGWLYYEPDQDSDDPRGTRWEIHPVTSIQSQ
jgi:hypothetical protein